MKILLVMDFLWVVPCWVVAGCLSIGKTEKTQVAAGKNEEKFVHQPTLRARGKLMMRQGREMQ
jgi:hypothetical protein